MDDNKSKNLAIEQVLAKMLKGTVPVISADKLQASLLHGVDWLVLDSREYSEFEVSHLPNSRWVGYSDFSLSKMADVAKDSQIVVYCSIGVRSEQIAEQLISAGFCQVKNLYGGIFNWANLGKPVVDQLQHNTLCVHGYDQNWSKLVVNPVGDKSR
jgi:rhodanese-related sulfurtransferase